MSNKNIIDLSSIQRKKNNTDKTNIVAKPIEYVIPTQSTVKESKSLDVIPQVINSDSVLNNKAKKPKDKKSKSPETKNDEINEKKKLSLILKFYLLEFPDKLEMFKNTKFNNMSSEELIEIRNQMDDVLSNRSNLKQTEMIVHSGIRMFELAATTVTPIKCEGLSNLVLKDPECLDSIKHIALKHMSQTTVKPEAQLFYKILTNMYLLHNINTSLSSKPTGVVDPLVNSSTEIQNVSLTNSKLIELTNKYNDL